MRRVCTNAPAIALKELALKEYKTNAISPAHKRLTGLRI